MEFLQKGVPRRLSARVWLVSLPTALFSFERRQHVPQLPIGKARWAGVPMVAAGVALILWTWRRPNTTLAYRGPMQHLAQTPATLGGTLALAGVAVFLRSTVLACYAAGIAALAGGERIAIDAPEPANLGLGETDFR